MSENSKGVWVKAIGMATAGGDPAWECSLCGGGTHVFGIEHIWNYRSVCPDCGNKIRYPWEIRDEQITDVETDL